MKKISLSRLFDDNRFLTVFSLVSAVLLYISIAITQQDTTNYTIHNVPVDLSIHETDLAAQGLNIIEGGEYTVDVTIRGPRTEVPRYDDPELLQLATTAQLAGITEAGTHRVNIISAYSGPDELPFEIVGYSPSTIEVTLDRLQTKTFTLETNIQGDMTTPDGYVLDGATVSPGQITVSGPESEINEVAGAKIVYELTEPLKETLTSEVAVVLKDAEGNAIDMSKSHLTLDSEEAQLTIKVLKEAELPLRVDFLNMPDSFPEDNLRDLMKMTAQTVRIAGPASIIDNLTEIHLGYIDLSELQPENNTFQFDVDLESISDQIISLDNVSVVEVSFGTANWTTEVYTVENINLLNVPADYDVSLITSAIANVELVGIGTALDGVDVDDIVAEVDLSKRMLNEGQQSYLVTVCVPEQGLVWALDDHMVYIRAVKKES